MKKAILSLSVSAVLIGIFHLFVFLLPLHRTPTFWAVYSFTLLALLIHTVLTCLQMMSQKPSTRFLKLPAFAVGSVYLACQILACILLMIFSSLALQYTILICAVLFGGFLVLLLTCALSNYESGTDDAGRVNEPPVRSLALEIDLLAMKATSSTQKNALTELASSLRYSPLSDLGTVRDAELRLFAASDDLKAAVNCGDETAAATALTEMQSTLAERNLLCRQAK